MPRVLHTFEWQFGRMPYHSSLDSLVWPVQYSSNWIQDSQSNVHIGCQERRTCIMFWDMGGEHVELAYAFNEIWRQHPCETRVVNTFHTKKKSEKSRKMFSLNGFSETRVRIEKQSKVNEIDALALNLVQKVRPQIVKTPKLKGSTLHPRKMIPR